MKKLFYVAIMALAVVFTSCAGKSGSSDFYNNGKEPEIDFNAGTVNGVKYNDTDNKCWVYTTKITVAGLSSKSSDTYIWGTEFAMVAACETAMYVAHETPLTKASYTYKEVIADEEGCEELMDEYNKD